MTIERAIEILDPEHREHYGNIEVVNEACRMGMTALEKQHPSKPVENDKKPCGYSCPICGYAIFRVGVNRDNYCSQCGQRMDWSDYNA